MEEEIDRLISLGLHGIKLHPDFQNFAINDEKGLPRCMTQWEISSRFLFIRVINDIQLLKSIAYG